MEIAHFYVQSRRSVYNCVMLSFVRIWNYVGQVNIDNNRSCPNFDRLSVELVIWLV